MSKKVKQTDLKDVFDIPEKGEIINTEHIADDDVCCKTPKMPQIEDPDLKKEINAYINEIKRGISLGQSSMNEMKSKQGKEDKPPRKNNVSEEGRKQMLANLKRGRETRKINLNKAHEVRQQELKADIDEVKSLLKNQRLSVEQQPKTADKTPQPTPEAPKPIETPKPAVVITQPQKPYIVHSTFRKPMW
jgi:hypothetical protein